VAVVGNSDALGLLAVDAAAASGLTVTRSIALGSEANADDFEHALDEAIDDPEVDSLLTIYIPPLNSGGAEVANALATVAEQSDKPMVSTFLGREGVPELLRVPDLAGSTAGRGSVPSYPAVESAVRALAGVVEYVGWLDKQVDADTEPEGVDEDAAARQVARILIDSPEGRVLGHEETHELLGHYGIDLWDRRAVATVDEAVAIGEELGWDVVLKATAEPLRQRPDLAHVWRNIMDAGEMRHAWAVMNESIRSPETAGFVIQRTATSGVPIAIEGLEDPFFGPAVSFSISGALPELVGDKAYQIPPVTAAGAAEMVRSIKAAPLLFGFRGSDRIDVDAVEDLIRRVAELKNDLAQVCSIHLDLVIASESGVAVLNAQVEVQPVADPRSDWFVRRLTTLPGDTMHD
jgi:acyl-CoA synthetase (NDP forming)